MARVKRSKRRSPSRSTRTSSISLLSSRKSSSRKKSPQKLRGGSNDFAAIHKRLDTIEALLRREDKEEQEVLAEEKQLLAGEAKEVSELAEIEKLEEQIKGDLEQHPLTKITYHDVTKGLIGAFFGVVGHFAFFEGQHLAETMSIMRASFVFLASMLLLVLFLYFSGFRRVKEYHDYLPVRFLVIYCTAILVAIAVLFLFGVLALPLTFHELYTNTAALSILAVMGAATADLIGGEA